MIQRKQTVFLLLACIVALVCLFMRLQWLDALQAVSAVLSAYTIFQFRRRILQARLCLAGLFVIFAWYIGLAVLEGRVGTVEGLPMVNAILIFLARKGILDDEKLVRAADRIR
jgi:membrane associated rhomboid family serine protease